MNDTENTQEPAKLFEAMLNNIGAFIFAKNIHGEYTYANQAVLDLFEKPLHEVIGKDDSHFFDLTASSQLKDNDNQVMSEGVVVSNEEENYIKSTGQLHVYRSIKKPLYDDQGRVIGLFGVSTDITEEVQLQKLVREQKQLLDTVLNNIDAYVYMKNSQREFLYVNNQTAELFGLPVEDIIGHKETDILPAEVAEHFHQSDSKVFETKEKQVIDEEVIGENGQSQRYLSIKVPYQAEGKLPALIGFSSDVTELYQLKEEFKKQANTDHLTQLFNRRYFIAHAEKEFSRAKRYDHPLSLVSLDIDHFKQVNDQYGHPAGDEVLMTLAKRLTPILRNEDIFARIGGEEFSILLPETPINVALTVAERIRKLIENTHMIGEFPGEINITISLGVTCLSSKDNSFDQLFKRADKALYQAKETGRNKVATVIHNQSS